MPSDELVLNPVSHITVDAIGQPGSRTFYIQAWKNDQVVTVIVEKVQIQTLAVGIEQFLAEIKERLPNLTEAEADFDESKMSILPPVDPLFRVGEMGLAYETEQDRVILEVREVMMEAGSEQDTHIVRLWCTRQQIHSLAAWGIEVANRGRAICPQCGEPMDPAGHFCPKKNGHKH